MQWWNESFIRLAVFALVLVLMAVWELAAPRRPQGVRRSRRWPANLGIAALNAVMLKLVLPLSAMGFALYVQTQGWGLFNWLHAPVWAAIPLAFVLLDLAIYAQHVLFHAVPVLWRLHRMHHADLEFDVTTGLRFHPVEMLLSMGIKFAVIAALGPPLMAVLLFEVMLNATAMFNHGNVRLPLALDAVLRRAVVTPDMHRVHHSIVPAETNSNFGFNLPWWDRLFGTYRAQPAAGHDAMTIGIAAFRAAGELRLGRMLLQPFRSVRVPERVGGSGC